MRYVSVCSGIEAATVAWHPLGWTPLAFAEIEAFPSAVLSSRFPNVPNLGDILAAPWEAFTSIFGPVDVLIGGTPCQAFSVAGLRQGLADDRGNLTLKFVEIADALDPQFVVWENVPGVLSDRTNAFGHLLAGLAGEDSALEPPGGKWTHAGYVLGPSRAVAWRVLDAQYLGLAQRRKRVFVVACPRDGHDPLAILFEREGVRRDHPPSREAGQEVAGTLSARPSAGGGLGTDFDLAGGVQAFSMRGRDGESVAEAEAEELSPALRASQGGSDKVFVGIEGRVQAVDTRNGTTGDIAHVIQHGGGKTKHGIGNLSENDIPHVMVIHDLAQTLTQSGRGVQRVSEPRGQDPVAAVVPTLDARYGRLRCSNQDLNHGHSHLVVEGVRGDVSHSLDTANKGKMSSEDGTGRGVPIVGMAFGGNDTRGPIDVATARNAHGGPHGRLDFESKTFVMTPFDTTQLTSKGNYSHPKPGHPLAAGANPPAVAFERNQDPVSSSDVAMSLRKECPGVATDYAVRRLTPRECERLQGFPDDYTLLPATGARKVVQDVFDYFSSVYLGKFGDAFVRRLACAPDGPRYKALGNSMAVPVIRWIGRRIDMVAKT